MRRHNDGRAHDGGRGETDLEFAAIRPRMVHCTVRIGLTSVSAATTGLREESHGQDVAQPEASRRATLEIDLKDPRLAAFLAWLVPGLGHFYQGRTGKGVLFFVCILGTFVYGLYIGGGRVVYASTPSLAHALAIFLPARRGPAGAAGDRAAAAARGGKDAAGGRLFMRPPRMSPPATRGDFRRTISRATPCFIPTNWPMEPRLGDMFEMGTVFTVDRRAVEYAGDLRRLRRAAGDSPARRQEEAATRNRPTTNSDAK